MRQEVDRNSERGRNGDPREHSEDAGRSHGKESGGDDRKQNQSASQTSPWEWAIGAFGALLVLGTVGYLLYQGIYIDSTPPDIVVRIDSVRTVQEGYLLLYSVENRGGSAAAGLTVRGELRADTGSIEQGSSTLDYVPSRSERHGGIFFSRDPREYELRLRPDGYEVP